MFRFYNTSTETSLKLARAKFSSRNTYCKHQTRCLFSPNCIILTNACNLLCKICLIRRRFFFLLCVLSVSIMLASRFPMSAKGLFCELQNDKWATHRNNWPLDPGLAALSELLQIGESCCRGGREREKANALGLRPLGRSPVCVELLLNENEVLKKRRPPVLAGVGVRSGKDTFMALHSLNLSHWTKYNLVNHASDAIYCSGETRLFAIAFKRVVVRERHCRLLLCTFVQGKIISQCKILWFGVRLQNCIWCNAHSNSQKY
jgi:hypothetical protein